MSPLWQVIIGELVGTMIIMLAIATSRDSDTFSTGMKIVFGAMAFFLLVSWLFIGDKNLFFSTYAFKNILLIIVYEELIWLASALLASVVSYESTIDLNDYDFMIIWILIAVIASIIFGAQGFYAGIVKQLG